MYLIDARASLYSTPFRQSVFHKVRVQRCSRISSISNWLVLAGTWCAETGWLSWPAELAPSAVRLVTGFEPRGSEGGCYAQPGLEGVSLI